LLALRFAVTFAFAIVSFYLIERPVRERRLPGTRAFGVRPAALLGGVAGVVVVTVFASTAGAMSWTDYFTRAQVTQAKVNVGAPRILTAGDSSSFTLVYNITKEVNDAAHWQGTQRLGCGFMRTGVEFDGTRTTERNNCNGIIQQWTQEIATFNPDLVVMIAGPWEVLNQIVDGQVVEPGSPKYNAAARAAIEDSLNIFTKRGAEVVYLDIPCFGPVSGSSIPERGDPKRATALNKVLYSVAAQDKRLHILQWSNFLCPGGHFQDKKDGVVIRTDGVHFPPDGAHVVWKWLGPQLLQLGREAQAARKVQAPTAHPTSTTSTKH
jgi:hypothetical protein